MVGPNSVRPCRRGLADGRGQGKMTHHLEPIHLAGNDPKWNMPYTPAVKVRAGSLVFVSGVTAAPVYHSHPHVPSEFEDIPSDPGRQAQMAMDNLKAVLEAAGGGLTDIVQLFRFMVAQDRNQDAINRVMAECLGQYRATTTSVEVVRLATDPRLILELAAVAVVPD
jgi:enamine deaminase RidA (YjgF/YER057c/UK114 family)